MELENELIYKISMLSHKLCGDLDCGKCLFYDGTFCKLRKYVVEHEPVDAVPVVRCKDCVHYKRARVNRKGFLICRISGMDITEDDYCSYGEKRENE